MSVILRTNHVTKRYGSRPVVSDLSMTIHKGDIYGFIGKNGAGKTTLIRMITGLAAEICSCSESPTCWKVARRSERSLNRQRSILE